LNSTGTGRSIFVDCFEHCNKYLCFKISVFENRVLVKLFGPNREVVTGKRIKLDTEKLY
jgi:hypothetical protein